jgi:hypothetical protein
VGIYSYKMPKLVQLLAQLPGQLGVFLTCRGRASSDGPVGQPRVSAGRLKT